MSGLERPVALLAKLLGRLEAAGVLVQEVSAKDFFGDSPSNEDSVLFANLVDWLLAEGVIRRVSSPKGDGFGWIWFHQLVLTSRGFQLLGSKFSNDLNLSQAVRKVGSIKGDYSGLGDFLGGVLGGFTKSVSN